MFSTINISRYFFNYIIMRRLITHTLIYTAVILCSITQYSCEKNNNSDASDLKIPIKNEIDREDGTILRFLNGTVTLTLSPLEVKKSFDIKVTQYLNNECMDMSDCNWIQNMIYIEPLITFSSPVIVTINYDKDLIDKELGLHGNIPVVYYWQNEEDFANLTRRTTIFYDFDADYKTINFIIKKSGLYSIGVFIPDKS
jgi:hypothetical protein